MVLSRFVERHDPSGVVLHLSMSTSRENELLRSSRTVDYGPATSSSSQLAI